MVPSARVIVFFCLRRGAIQFSETVSLKNKSRMVTKVKGKTVIMISKRNQRST
jgi:hypothetical protein